MTSQSVTRPLTMIILGMILSVVGRGSCALDPSPPCTAFWKAEVVFTGTVIRTTYSEIYERGEKEKWNYQDRIAHFAVDEVFRGSVGGQVKVVAPVVQVTPFVYPDGTRGSKFTSGGDCSYKFKDGERYLVYANLSLGGDGTLRVSFNRTRTVNDATEDLRYIRGLHQAKPHGRIFGVVQQSDLYLKRTDQPPANRPVAGIGIVVKSLDRSYRTFTDEAGRFEIADLPPGDYEVEALLSPEQTAITPAKVKVPERGCAEVNLYTSTDGRITGTVFDDQGRPLPKIKLDLALANQDQSDPNPQVYRAYADDAGRYEFKSVPEGRYVLGFRLDAIGERGSPYPRTYYPGTDKLADAQVFDLKTGERIERIDFVMPPRLGERIIEGEVVWPDGRPVVGASVRLRVTEYPVFSDGDSAASDSIGKFSINAFDGLSYLVIAWVNTEGGGQMHAEVVDLPSKGNVGKLKLVVTTAGGSCERCRLRLYPRRK